MTIGCCKVSKVPPPEIPIPYQSDPSSSLEVYNNSNKQCISTLSPLSQHNDDAYMSLLSPSLSANLEAPDEYVREAGEAEPNPVHIKTKQTLLGMLVVAVGTALFCTVGAIVQHHGGSVLQLMLGRYATQNILSWFVWFVNPCQIKTNACHWYGDQPHRSNVWLRGFLLFCTVFFWWKGLELVSIGDGEAILFLSPLTTVIAARVLLGEQLPSTFAVSLVLTMTGLVFICQPGFIFGSTDTPMSWQGVLFLIGAAFAWTGACVLVRTAKEAHWLQLEIVSTVQSVVIWCPLAIVLNQFWLHSEDLSFGDWDFSLRTALVMIVIGVLGFFALMLNVIGYQIGDATKVAWMEYLDLVFAFLYQWLYFQDEPTMWEIVGCCSLLSTCLIHLGEEYYNYVQATKQQNSSLDANQELRPLLLNADESKYKENHLSTPNGTLHVFQDANDVHLMST